jgi:hypothetical protein
MLAVVMGLAAFAPIDAITRDAPVRQYLDRSTAATVTAMDRPLVFAHERASLAANARDYMSLVAIDVNRGGNHRLYWFCFVWTTIDDGGQLAAEAPNAEWLLLADARPIALRRASATPRDLGIGETPVDRPVRNATAVVFETDAEVLGYLTAANQLSLRRADGTDYALWRDARDELKAFLRQLAR